MQKFTQGYVEDFFKINNCELLDTYKDIKAKLKYKCVCGETSLISFDNFKRGRRCKKCGIARLSNTFKHDIEYVRQEFIRAGCIPLFDEYINGHTPLRYQCECGAISQIAFMDFKSGKRCNNCRVERIQKSKSKYGSQMCSLQQKKIHNLVGGILNFPLNNLSLDIAFENDKIYIEYDCSGHDLSVKLGSISQIEFDKKEVKRRYVLYRRGWKEIRIISKRDNFPSDDILEIVINDCFNILKAGRSWVIIDLDNSQIVDSTNAINYDFGKLKRIRSDKLA